MTFHVVSLNAAQAALPLPLGLFIHVARIFFCPANLGFVVHFHNEDINASYFFA